MKTKPSQKHTPRESNSRMVGADDVNDLSTAPIPDWMKKETAAWRKQQKERFAKFDAVHASESHDMYGKPLRPLPASAYKLQ